MKKAIYTAITSLFVFCAATGAHAQVPAGIVINAAGDTVWNTFNSCQAPDTVGIYLYGTAGGYQAGDSVTIHIAFGDGTDTTYLSPIYQNAYFNAYFPHIYMLPGIYSQLFIVTGPNGAADTVINNNAVIIGSQCGNISGNVYYDDNSNCVFNTGDAAMPWVHVRLLYQGSYVMGTYTDVNGDYFLSVPAGFTYEVEVEYNNANFNSVCPVTGSYTVSSLPAANLDFPTNCSTSGYDLAGSLNAWGFRPGLTANIYFHWWNKSCNLVTGTATITLPPGLSYVSGVPAPSNVSGNLITYNVSPYPFYWVNWWSGNNYIKVVGDTSLTIGDTLCVTMQLDPTVADLNPADNLVEVCAPVRNSCDPNEKFEKHAFWGTANVAPGTRLDYTLFFQNVGNDVAYTVQIVDTLDADLDLTSLQVSSSSHPMTIRMVDTDILKFEFLNINLPAASVNEPLSHGYVNYSISPKAGLTQGTVIDNTAHIFFDFNGPVVTNTVYDIIDLAVGVNGHLSDAVVSAYPNPAVDYLQIRNLPAQVAVVRIAGMSGKQVAEYRLETDGRLYIGNLPVGVYLMSIRSGDLNFSGKLVVVK